MFRLVKRRFRPVIYLLVLAQLLLSAPMVSAVAAAGSDSGTTSMSMPCADDMPTAEEMGNCPCCPEGVTSEAGCLVTCIASVAPVQTFAPVSVAQEATAPAERIDSIAVGIADPPLKPPPIS